MSHRHSPPGQHEHEFEAEHGLPEALPAGERLLWQGAPDWRALAWHVFHVREVLVYFGLLLGWRALDVGLAGGGLGQALLALLWLTPLAALALGLLGGLAWLSARTAVYTVTTQRTVMRVGIVLSVTFNLPHRQVDGVALRSRAHGRGDLALLLAPGERIGWLHLWPHARPWRVRRPEPALRCIPDAARVGALLSQALAERPVTALAKAPAAPLRPAAHPDAALA